MKKAISVRDELADFLLYTTPNGNVKVEAFLYNETIWLSQKKIAELFGVQRPAITKHLGNIFDSGELDEKVVCSILELPTWSFFFRKKIIHICYWKNKRVKCL